MSETGWQQNTTAAAADWARIKSMLYEVLEAPKSQRIARAHKLCAAHPHLLDELLALLAQDEAEDVAIDQPAVRLSDSTPEQIGRYHVIRQLGQGGMSSVYLAQSDEPNAPQVAIKTLRASAHTQHLAERLERERQVLANLDHPHIAKLLEGGRDHNGQPFLVMPYIEGQQLDQYCDQNRLSIAQRVALFIKICEAVHSAHAKLILHRDLKPSNILIDSDGEPHLLDFGIAKLLQPTSDANTPLTATHMRPMTPAYAAPEQVRDEPLTTLTDVYALGLVLYELLIGQQAQAVLQPHFAHLLDVIALQQPLSFRQHFTQADQQDSHWQDIAQKRDTHTKGLRKHLCGDLQAIVTKAIRKEPEARYASAKALADDLRRYLNGDPVSAVQGQLGYVVAKFAVKYRAQLLLSGALVLLLGLLSFGLWQSKLDQRQRQQQRQAMTQFMLSLLSIDPSPKPSAFSTITRSQQLATPLLDLAEQRLETLQNQQPAQRAQLLRTLGKVYQNRGQENKAAIHLYDALEIQKNLPSPQPSEELQTRMSLLQHCFSLGAIDEGFEHVARIHELLAQLPKAAWQLRAQALLAELEFRQESLFFWRGKEAEMQACQQQLEKLFSEPERQQQAIYIEFQRLSLNSCMMTNSLRDCLAIGERALELGRQKFGVDHLINAQIESNIALLYLDMAREEQALFHLNNALPIIQERLGSDHPKLGFLYFFEGLILMRMGEHDKAQPILERANQIISRTDMRQNYHKLSTLYFLSYTLMNEGLDQAAAPLLQQGMAILDMRPQYQAMASGFHMLYARLLMKEQRISEAKEHYETAMAQRLSELGTNHYLTGYAYVGMAQYHLAVDQVEPAKKLLHQSIDIGIEQGIRSIRMRWVGVQVLLQIADSEQDWPEAVRLLELILPETAQSMGHDHPQVVTIHLIKTDYLLKQDKLAEAKASFAAAKASIGPNTNLSNAVQQEIQRLQQVLNPSGT